MDKKWEVKDSISLEFQKKFPEIPSLVLQLLHNRDLDTQEKIDQFLNPDYGQDLLDPFLFSDMKKAVDRIYQAVAKKEKIYIHGDYDADGVTSSVLLAKVLQQMGADFNVYIPHREKEGYGLNSKTIKYLIRKKTQLIITVDCAVANAPEIAQAKEKGIDVIVTDHHEEPLELPQAYAILDPKVKKCKYPFYDLAGVGVAFKLAQAIIQKDSNNIFPQGFEKWLLDLVAVGTVADMMPLLNENRVLVKYGLVVLNKTRNIGLKKLAQKAGIWQEIEQGVISTENIGFKIGPRINAAGRMDHANAAFNLLITKDSNEADNLVNDLEKNNQQRQAVTDKIIEDVKKKIKDLSKEYIILAENKNWPLGIIGLAASRIKDKYNRPVLLIGRLGRKYAGSGRSIPEFDLMAGLSKLDELFEVYGGHAQAAGFTLKNKKQIADFRLRITELAKQELEGKDLRPKLEIEAELDLQNLNWELYDQIKQFEPFGRGNPHPVFVVKNLRVETIKTVGSADKHLKLYLKQENMVKSFAAIGFGMGDKIDQLKYGDKVDVVTEITLNEYNGSRNLELRLIDIRKK